MGPNQTCMLLYSKENYRQNEKTTYGLGENICKWCNWQKLNVQNIQIAQATQKQKPTQSKINIISQWQWA